MPKSPQLWLVAYQQRNIKDKLVTPLLTYKWEVMLWLTQLKPGAEILSIEPHRQMAAK